MSALQLACKARSHELGDVELTVSYSFAFRFLIDIAKRLDWITEPDSYIKRLRERILVVCRGHLIWLFEIAESLNEFKYFAANYWVTGTRMLPHDASWMPENSLTDTAFQIVKVAEFASLYPKTEDGLEQMEGVGKRIRSKIGTVYRSWIDDLQGRDKRCSLTWPAYQSEDINIFRLDDHVWICKALKTVEDLILPKQSNHPREWPITSSAVQRETLGHFTTLNDVSGKRMLAVTRSPRETRFLLHARDTALFYGIDWGLPLADTPFQDIWKDTLEAQVHHDENQETGWNKALRYALAISMGSRKYSINKRSPEDLVECSFKVLIESTTQTDSSQAY